MYNSNTIQVSIKTLQLPNYMYVYFNVSSSNESSKQTFVLFVNEIPV